MGAREVYQEIYGTPPDTMSGDYRLFCLALYLCSKARNKNASEDHKEKIIKENPSVKKYVEEVRAHAERNNKQSETRNYKKGIDTPNSRGGYGPVSQTGKQNYGGSRFYNGKPTAKR
jgi:hypothetical protein